MKKKENKNLTSFADHLDQQYGKKGTSKRDAYEQEFEAFKLSQSSIVSASISMV